MATDVRNTGNNSAAEAAARRAAEAAEAARRAAAEAARRAEQARQQAEQARQAHEKAAKSAEDAAKGLGQARKELVHGQQQLDNARPEQREAAKKNVEQLKGEVDTAREKLKTANRNLLDAETKLQKAEEVVARESKNAEVAMLKANAAAKKDPINASNPLKAEEPFSQEDIAQAGPKAVEIKDAFDGTDGAQRDKLARKLGMDFSTDRKEIQANLNASRNSAPVNARQEQEPPKTPAGLGKHEGRELANRAADRAEENLQGELKGKKLSEIPPHVADRELKAALKKEAKARGINANDLKALEGTGSDSGKAKDFASAYAEQARNTLKDRLGGSAELVLNGSAGRELVTTTTEQTHRAAKAAFNEKTAGAASEVAGKNSFVEHSPKKQQEFAQARIDAAKDHVADKLASSDRDTKDKARLELAELLNEETGNLPRAEREKLLGDNKELLSEISAGANGTPSEEYRRGIIRELSQAAQAAGPDGTRLIAKEFAKNVINQHTDVDDKDQLGGAWKQSIKDGDGAALAIAVAGELKGKGLDEARNNILKGTREALKEVSSAFAKKSERINELETQYHEIVDRYGSDKKALEKALKEFKKDNAKLYEDFEETGRKAASALEGAGAVLRDKDLPEDLEREAVNLLVQTAEIGKTNAGREVLANAMALSGQGKPNVLDQLDKAAAEIQMFDPGFDAGEFQSAVSEQAIAGAGLKVINAGVAELNKGGEADLVFRGLIQQHKLLGATKDDLTQVASALKRTFTGDKGGIEELAEATGGGSGREWTGSERVGQALKGLGLALSLPEAAKNLSKITDGNAKLTDRIKATANTLGLAADGAGLALDVFGRADQLKALPKLLGGASAAAGLVTSVLDGIEGIEHLKKGNTYQGTGKLVGATGGFLASTGALLTLATASQAAPIVGQVGVALAASVVIGSAGLQAADAAQKRQERAEDTRNRANDILVDLGFNPEVAEKFADKETELRGFLDGIRKETGLSRKELAAKMKDLTPKQAEEFIRVHEHTSPGWYRDARKLNEDQRIENELIGEERDWNLPYPNLERPRYDRNSNIYGLPDPHTGTEWEQHPRRPKDFQDAVNYLRARGLI